MATKSYNVGIIGYGASAKIFHIPLIQAVSELNLYAVVQRNPTADNNAEKDHPGIKSYRSAEQMVKNSSIDLVVVTTTPATHFELAKLALENGKHVLVEKPFVPTFEEADRLVSMAQKYGKILTVYQNRRFDADFLTVSELIKNDTLGRIVEFESHMDRYKPSLTGAKPWKTRVEPGGGAIYDIGAHLLDQIVMLFGLPKRITAFLCSQREDNPNGYDDSCTVLLHYNGMLATVKVAVVSPETEQMRLWVRGVRGSFKKFHEDVQESHLTMGKKPGDEGFGIESVGSHGILTRVVDGKLEVKSHKTSTPLNYKSLYDRLAQALGNQGEVAVKPDEASSVIRLIELAKQSSNEGRTIDV